MLIPGRWVRVREPPPIRRRSLLGALGAAVIGAALTGCTLEGLPAMSPLPWPTSDEAARLTARPASRGTRAAEAAPGVHTLDLGPGPEVLVRVPSTDAAGPPRLVLTLHGAGGNARGGLQPLVPLADFHRLLLLSPSSRDDTWDVIYRRGWGLDVQRIDEALTQVLATFPVDVAHLAISGFSDGASYALSLGLANADLFTHIVAFSPGFVAAAPRVGTPRVYISHGRSDPVLPIHRTTRRIVPRLEAAGVPTTVEEFDGPHLVPPHIAENAVRWLTR